MPRRHGPPSPAQLSSVPLPTVHLARDVTPTHARAFVRDGTWLRARPGAYVVASDHATGTRTRSVALARMVALTSQSTVPQTFSHTSAAVAWGLPTVRSDGRTHVLQASRPGGRGDPGVVRHRALVPDGHRTQHRGLLVTTLERTLVDCIRTLPPLSGLIIADAALHVGADRDRCAQMLADLAGARGVVKAREILALADGGSESPGETTVRLEILRLGLPAPETQVRVETSASTVWADLGWHDWALLVEYDGRSKYDGTPTEVLLKERRRQDAVEDAGWHMVRVMKDDLRTPGLLRHRLLRHVPEDVRTSLRIRRVLNSR